MKTGCTACLMRINAGNFALLMKLYLAITAKELAKAISGPIEEAAEAMKRLLQFTGHLVNCDQKTDKGDGTAGF